MMFVLYYFYAKHSLRLKIKFSTILVRIFPQWRISFRYPIQAKHGCHSTLFTSVFSPSPRAQFDCAFANFTLCNLSLMLILPQGCGASFVSQDFSCSHSGVFFLLVYATSSVIVFYGPAFFLEFACTYLSLPGCMHRKGFVRRILSFHFDFALSR